MILNTHSYSRKLEVLIKILGKQLEINNPPLEIRNVPVHHNRELRLWPPKVMVSTLSQLIMTY